MSEYLIYGKIIIDDIRLSTGQIVFNVLGGGGPQAAFGARLWNNSVGLLSRSGTDLESEHVTTLRNLDIDLRGWHQYPDIPTTRNTLLDYDADGYMNFKDGNPLEGAIDRNNFTRLLQQVLPLPVTYQEPRMIHLITEFADEPMIQTAMQLQKQGAIFSLEPIIDFALWSNRASILGILPHVDIATPDWPSASGIAGKRGSGPGSAILVAARSPDDCDPAWITRIVCLGPGSRRYMAYSSRRSKCCRSNWRW